jgi:multidrug efflux pump subunit AcrA (membrane-fusion protein)
VVIRILTLVLAAAALQDPPPDDLGTVLARLRDVRASAYSRQRARAAEIEAARAPGPRLEAELAEFKTREAEVDRQIAEIRAEVEKLKASESALAAAQAGLNSALEGAAAERRRAVAAGIPFHLEERLVRAEGTKESLARHWTFLQEELRLARSGEAFTSEIPLPGGRRKSARCFRVGHLFAGYVTEDGLETGRWDGKAWVPAGSPEEERSIREAVEILDRRRAPALLRLAPGGRP